MVNRRKQVLGFTELIFLVMQTNVNQLREQTKLTLPNLAF